MNSENSNGEEPESCKCVAVSQLPRIQTDTLLMCRDEFHRPKARHSQLLQFTISVFFVL